MLEKAEGIVLRTVAYGESNVILTLFTREKGKMAVMARGAKKPKNRLAASAQPFVYGMFLYYKSSGMATLNQGDLIHSFRVLRSDILKAAYASYMTELLDKLTNERERNPYLFELIFQLFQRMNEDADSEVLTRLFETKMTEVAGIKPELDCCVNCRNPEGTFSFSIKEAGFLCHRCLHSDPYRLDADQKTIQLLRTFFYMDIKRLGEIKLSRPIKDELKMILGTYYEEYSGLNLKAKRFLDQMEKWDLS